MGIRIRKIRENEFPPSPPRRPFDAVLAESQGVERENLERLRSELSYRHGGGAGEPAIFCAITNETDPTLAFRHVVIMRIGDDEFVAFMSCSDANRTHTPSAPT